MGTTQGGVTARITREFRLATPEQVQRGIEWYQDAHRLAEKLAADHNFSLEQTSAMIAALSPQLSWGMNVAAAHRAAAGVLKGGVLSANIEKANRILAGEKISDVIGDSNSGSGHKVRSFYRCILTAGRDEREVCIDRHAFALAMGTRDVATLTAKLYRDTQEAFRNATKILDRERPFDLRPVLTPSAVQAVCWITWRARFWSEGAYDPKGM